MTMPKNNVLHVGWHKNHDENKCRRAGVGSSLKCDRPPELVILGYKGIKITLAYLRLIPFYQHICYPAN
jgi:hypothetical protein